MKKWYSFLIAFYSAKREEKTLSCMEKKKPADKHSGLKEDELLYRLEQFFCDHYEFRFNCLTETTEYRELSGQVFTTVGNRELNTLCLEARSRGIQCWDRDIARYVNSRKVKEYHPFRLYMEELPVWDGRDRVGVLARRVTDIPLWVGGFCCWMRGMAAQWMGIPSLHANSVAPVLVSLVQGMNKSTFCRMLVPPELQGYYTDSFELSNVAGAEQKLTVFGLINLDEMDKYSGKKMIILKNLMQMAGINIRKAYKKNYSALPRIASFIGTSNEKELLNDPSGSRRYLCVEVVEKIDCSAIDYPQVYAQLKAELVSGERYWFTTEEEQAIMQHNLPFQKRTMAEDVFHQCYRKPENDEEGQLITAARIFEVLKKRNPAAMQDVSPVHFGRSLIKLGLKRVHTRYGNRYEVVCVESR